MKIWGKGFTTIGEANFKSAGYVASIATSMLVFNQDGAPACSAPQLAPAEPMNDREQGGDTPSGLILFERLLPTVCNPLLVSLPDFPHLLAARALDRV